MPEYGCATSFKILVVGEEKVGKSCLICSVKGMSFTPKVPHVLSPIHITADFTDFGIPLVFKDTSSRNWTREKWEAELRQADVIILCYACNDVLTLGKVKSHWLPLFQSLEINAQIILTGCKSDLTISNVESLKAEVNSILVDHPEIDLCIEFSARTATGRNLCDFFFNVQRTAVYPCNILFDHSKGCLKPSCERALKRIFMSFDKDNDGILNDVELNNFQVTCFGEPLHNADILSTKNFVHEKFPEGVNGGITFSGFVFLHKFYIKKGHSAMPWTCLRKFGYDNRIQIRKDLLPTSLTWNSHQRVELSNEAMTFLGRIFTKFDVHHDGALQPARIDDLFSTAPESPWGGGHFVDAAENTVTGELTLNGFLSLWALMTLLDPASTFANLKYIGYEGNHSSTFYVSKRRGLFHKLFRQGRKIFQCFVLGPRKAGKSTLLNMLIGRPFLEEYIPTTQQHFAANVIDMPGQTEKILVMTEIPPDELSAQHMDQEFLSRCDVAIFVYDSSDENSWMQALDIFQKVSEHAAHSGFNVPCLFVAAKSDLEQQQFIKEEPSTVCYHMGLQPPMVLNLRSQENKIFQIILLAAQRADKNILNTDLREINFISYSLSVVGTTILGGLAALHLRNRKLKERESQKAALDLSIKQDVLTDLWSSTFQTFLLLAHHTNF